MRVNNGLVAGVDLLRCCYLKSRSPFQICVRLLGRSKRSPALLVEAVLSTKSMYAEIWDYGILERETYRSIYEQARISKA